MIFYDTFSGVTYLNAQQRWHMKRPKSIKYEVILKLEKSKRDLGLDRGPPACKSRLISSRPELAHCQHWNIAEFCVPQNSIIGPALILPYCLIPKSYRSVVWEPQGSILGPVYYFQFWSLSIQNLQAICLSCNFLDLDLCKTIRPLSNGFFHQVSNIFPGRLASFQNYSALSSQLKFRS